MKLLNDLTREEHKQLLQSGMLWEMYPEASGNYQKDAKYQLAAKYYKLKKEMSES